MGDGHGGGTHFDHDLADQVVDDAGHDGVKAGGGFVEEDDLGLGSDGAGKADAFLHAAREFRREQIGHIGGQAHTAQLLDRDFAGFFFGFGQRSAQQAEGDVLPDRQAVKQRAALKEHAEPGQKGVALDFRGVFAIQRDRPLILHHQAQNAFQQNRFPGAGATNDHHAFAAVDGQVYPIQNAFRAKGFMDVCQFNHVAKKKLVRRKLAARIRTAAASTEVFVARPTPCAPRPERIP